MPRFNIGYIVVAISVAIFSACVTYRTDKNISLNAAGNTNEIVVTQLVKTTKSWDGNTLPCYPNGTPEITILKITIPPKTTLHKHYHPVINAGVLLSGSLTVVTEKGETLHLKANDAIVEVVNKIHYGKNEGDVPAEIIVFYAGTSNSPITIKSH